MIKFQDKIINDEIERRRVTLVHSLIYRSTLHQMRKQKLIKIESRWKMLFLWVMNFWGVDTLGCM